MGFSKNTKSASSSSHSISSQTQPSGYIQVGQGLFDKKTPELEQRLELLELLLNEVNKTLTEHLKSQCRPAALNRYRRILKKALGRFLPGSSATSQKTHDSVSANSNSDSQISDIMNWLKNQQAAGQQEDAKPMLHNYSMSQPLPGQSEETKHMLHSSFLPHAHPIAPHLVGVHSGQDVSSLANTETHPMSGYLNACSFSELMATGPLPELLATSPMSELMATSPMSELMANSPLSELMTTSPMSELMDTEITLPAFSTSVMTTAERMSLRGASHIPESPILPTSPGVSPISSSTTSGSPEAMSSIWSSASTGTAFANEPTQSSLNYGMYTRGPFYGPHQLSTNGLLNEASPPAIHTIIGRTNNRPAQDFNVSSSHARHYLSPMPSRLTAYLPRYEATYPGTPLVTRHSGGFNAMNTWPGRGSNTFSSSEYPSANPEWDLPSVVDNQYVRDPIPLGDLIPCSLPATGSARDEEVPTEMTGLTDRSVSGQVAEMSSRYGCHPCGFYPGPGPDQRKKLRKHERTVTHLKTAGQGEVDSFPCGKCASTFTRRDNLRQHQKSCTRIRKTRRGVKECKKA